MKENFLERLKNKGMLLLDSAMGTMLQAAGLKSGEECGELWNLDHNAEKVLRVHRANVEKGSDIILTNTFGANPLKLAHYGAADQVRQINREGAQLAHAAAGEKAFVAGDIGPTGEILEESGGTATREAVRNAFQEQVAGLLEGGVDLFILETFMDIEELKLAVEAIRKNSSLPVIASMTFQANPAGIRTMWGLTPEEVARELTEASVDAVGANCGMGTRQMLQVMQEMARGTELPLAAQPNAGTPEVRGEMTVYPETAEQMAELAPEFKAAGVKILGGCCGTTPEYIAAIKDKLGL